MDFDQPLFVTFLAYLLLILYLGIKAYRRTHDLGDYILGGRKLGSAVTALSVGASDMSGWLLLGLPGAIYLSGLSEIWIGIGLTLGAWFNWLFVARPLRVYSQQANNALTLPDYFENRFQDKTRILRCLSAAAHLPQSASPPHFRRSRKQLDLRARSAHHRVAQGQRRCRPGERTRRQSPPHGLHAA